MKKGGSLEVDTANKAGTTLADPKDFDPNAKFGVNTDKDGNALTTEAKEKMEKEFEDNIKGKSD
jgi:hypothetical protein